MRWLALAVVLVAGCKGRQPGLPGGHRATPAKVVASLEAIVGAHGSPVAALAGTVAGMCGQACACLEEDVFACTSLCSPEARARAAAAPPEARMSTLIGACGGPRALGLTAESAPWATSEWLVVYVAGKYLADQYAAASTEDQRAIAGALARVRLPLAPPIEIVGRYRLAQGDAARGVDGPTRWTSIDEQGALAQGHLPIATLTARGATLALDAGDDADRDILLILADAHASARRVVEVAESQEVGSILAVDHGGRVGASPVELAGWGGSPAHAQELVVEDGVTVDALAGMLDDAAAAGETTIVLTKR